MLASIPWCLKEATHELEPTTIGTGEWWRQCVASFASVGESARMPTGPGAARRPARGTSGGKVMALAREDLAFPQDAHLSRPGSLRLVVTLTVIVACYLGLAWETLPGSWAW